MHEDIRNMQRPVSRLPYITLQRSIAAHAVQEMLLQPFTFSLFLDGAVKNAR